MVIYRQLVCWKCSKSYCQWDLAMDLIQMMRNNKGLKKKQNINDNGNHLVSIQSRLVPPSWFY